MLAVESTGTVTWTADGSIRTPSTTVPAASTATAWALCERSTGVSPYRSVAYTAATAPTRLCEPETVTSDVDSAATPG